MSKIDKQKFTEAIRAIVKSIPKGRAMTYGQIAALLGYPRVAQYVGWVMPLVRFFRCPLSADSK
ncbi:MAG: MGMT family protein [Patescibacteria group bacterium]|nr:MGMT family protein [Patescibacteria group bacterium]